MVVRVDAALLGERAERMLRILVDDRENHLLLVDAYMRGEHAAPYTPPQADDEFKMLAGRSITNWMPMPVNAVAQGMAVDGYRPGPDMGEARRDLVDTPQWDFWQRSRMDARQAAIYRSALTYGHSFMLVYRKGGKALAKGLSPLFTTILFEDAANDDEPIAALNIRSFGGPDEPASGTLWDERFQWSVSFPDGKARLSDPVPHGASECPVIRFAAAVDLEGRTVGLVEPLIPLQDRINQTVFDLLIAQTYGSFKVRTITGMAPPMETEPVFETDETGARVIDPATGQPRVTGFRHVIDPATGRPKPAPMRVNAAKFMISDSKDTRFGTLDETPLDGYLESIKQAVQHFAALSQTPPHYMLGEIINTSADALDAAEHSLTRKTSEFQNQFGEAWERVFRLAMSLEGDVEDDYKGEVLWRDLGAQAFAQIADGLGKAAVALGVPKRGLWKRFPGVTQNELSEWNAYYEEENPGVANAQAAFPASGRAGVSMRERLTGGVAAVPPVEGAGVVES